MILKNIDPQQLLNTAKNLEGINLFVKKNQNKIILENTKDIKIAKSKKLKENLIKRLALNNNKISSIIKSIETIAKFKDPVDVDIETWKRPNGLKIKKVSIKN